MYINSKRADCERADVERADVERTDVERARPRHDAALWAAPTITTATFKL